MNPDKATVELAPCPFCGGEPRMSDGPLAHWPEWKRKIFNDMVAELHANRKPPADKEG